MSADGRTRGTTEIHRYRLGGLLLTSDVRLASLPEVSAELADGSAGGGAPELRLTLAPAPFVAVGATPGPWLVERTLPGGDAPYLRVAGTPACYLLAHARGVDVEVRGGTDVTIVRLDPRLDAEDLEHLLVDQLLPLVVGRLGRLSLHGSAVAWGGAAVAVLAPSGTGKSTLAAAAVVRGGASFLADDDVVLEAGPGSLLLHPSYPSARLRADASRFVVDAPGGVDGKRRVPLRAAAGAVPLRAVVLLERGRATVATRLGRRDAVPAMAEHVDRLDPTDRAALRAELGLLAAIAEGTPVLRLVVADDLAAIDDAVDALRAVAVQGAGAPFPRAPSGPDEPWYEGPVVELSDDTRLRGSDDVLVRNLDGEAVLLDLASGTYFGLNEVGTRVWELMADGAALGAIKATLLAEFDVDEPVLSADLAALVAALVERGLVRPSP